MGGLFLLRKREVINVGKIIHGHAQGGTTSHEYSIWSTMIQRCTNPKNKRYEYYGGRGITVCERWISSFENFIEDMGYKPSSKHSIDRIDNNKGYSPDNCRWGTIQEQSRNKRMQKNNTSGVKGVSWDKRRKKYQTFIWKDGKAIYLGHFEELNEAAKARRKAEITHWAN
jgi:hypothetical protein